MKKIKVVNLKTLEVWNGQIKDPTAWIAECVASNAWGLPERPELDEMGQPTGVILPAEYTISIEDITAQVAQEAVNSEALAYLALTDWYIIREMDQGTPCPAEVKAERAAARARIVR